MKNRILKSVSGMRALLFVAVVSTLVAPQRVDAQNGTPAHSRVAVIDIKYILENHNRFKQAMEGLKKQFDQAGEQLKAERIRIQEMEMKLRELKPATPDYNQLDEEVNRAKAEWTLKANKQKKEIRKNESQILWNVYYEVKTETKVYCEKNGIDLVISFNGEPVDPQQPQQVVRGVSKPIVYNHPGIDITPHVLASLNNQQRAAGGLAQPPNNIGVPAQR